MTTGRAKRRGVFPARLALVAAVLSATALLSGCAFAIEGRALAAARASAGIDPGFIRGTDGGEDDRLAAATFRDLEGFWKPTFPSISGGRAFAPPAGYVSVDSSRPGQSVPCLRASTEIEGNAFYCPRADVIAYDRAALLPVLRQEFGDSAAVVVIAHEFGHAVQERLDASSGGPGEVTQVPTILSEGQADCYGGLFLRQVREGRTPNLRTGPAGVDAAMAALVTFRDPVGTGAVDDNAHGNAFDRVTSFQIGFDGDAATCSDMTVQNRRFTQTAFTSLRDQSNLGNLPLGELLQAMGPDLDRFFGGVVRGRSAPWTTPTIVEGRAVCDGGSADESQGPIAFCATGAGDGGGGPVSVQVDRPALESQHRSIGDYATGTLLASRYGLAATGALGMPTTGPEAGRRAVCLAGAYTGAVGDPRSGFGLSPGDLDESVQILLRSDQPALDADGVPGADTGYERIRLFRTGVTGGPDACLGRI